MFTLSTYGRSGTFLLSSSSPLSLSNISSTHLLFNLHLKDGNKDVAQHDTNSNSWQKKQDITLYVIFWRLADVDTRQGVEAPIWMCCDDVVSLASILRHQGNWDEETPAEHMRRGGVETLERHRRRDSSRQLTNQKSSHSFDVAASNTYIIHFSRNIERHNNYQIDFF